MTEQPTTQQPYTEADVELVAAALQSDCGFCAGPGQRRRCQDHQREAPLALRALAAAGRLLPEGASAVEQLGVRVDEPHPARSERAGQIHTHFPEENARRAREVWKGWTVVRRDRIEWNGPWTPATDDNANG